MTKRLYDITYPLKEINAPFKFRIGKTAVGHIGKGNTEAPQYFARCKKTTLTVSETYAIFIGTLVPWPPQENGQCHFPGKSGNQVFCAKVTVGKEKPVYPLIPEQFYDPGKIPVIKKESFAVDAVNINNVYPQFQKTIPGKTPVPERIRRAEYTPPCRGIAQSDFIHD
jgi:hypothetical protein